MHGECIAGLCDCGRGQAAFSVRALHRIGGMHLNRQCSLHVCGKVGVVWLLGVLWACSSSAVFEV